MIRNFKVIKILYIVTYHLSGSNNSISGGCGTTNIGIRLSGTDNESVIQDNNLYLEEGILTDIGVKMKA